MPEVRNCLLHHKREMPGREKIEAACAAIDEIVHELVNSGISPTVFALSKTEGDAFGRQRVVMASDSQAEVILVRPTQLHLAGFPPSSDPQVIMVAARLAATGEPLRFRTRYDSSYQEMWKNYPKHAPKSPRTAAVSETA